LSGLEIAKKCKSNNVKTKIVLITLHKEKELYIKAQELNIFGYILKESALEEIENCIRSVWKGVPYFSEKVTDMLKQNSAENEALDNLTPSEK